MSDTPLRRDREAASDLGRRAFLAGVAAATGAVILPGRTAVAATPSLIRDENARPGARDWQLTRVRVDKDGFRSPWIEGYCSKQSVKAGESIDIMVSTNPPRRFEIEIFRMGYYGGRGARLMTDARPVRGQGPAHAHARPQEPARVPVGAAPRADDPRRLAQRRLSRPAHDARRRERRALLAELRRLHRPRRPPRRHPLPVLRQHLAGLQPLAEQLLGLHPSQGNAGALGRRQLRPPLRPRGPVPRPSSTTRSRSARASSCRSSSRWPTGSSSTATTSPIAPTATCSRPITA